MVGSSVFVPVVDRVEEGLFVEGHHLQGHYDADVLKIKFWTALVQCTHLEVLHLFVAQTCQGSEVRVSGGDDDSDIVEEVESSHVIAHSVLTEFGLFKVPHELALLHDDRTEIGSSESPSVTERERERESTIEKDQGKWAGNKTHILVDEMDSRKAVGYWVAVSNRLSASDSSRGHGKLRMTDGQAVVSASWSSWRVTWNLWKYDMPSAIYPKTIVIFLRRCRNFYCFRDSTTPPLPHPKIGDAVAVEVVLLARRQTTL